MVLICSNISKLIKLIFFIEYDVNITIMYLHIFSHYICLCDMCDLLIIKKNKKTCHLSFKRYTLLDEYFVR